MRWAHLGGESPSSIETSFVSEAYMRQLIVKQLD